MKKGILLSILICTMGMSQSQKYDFLDQVGLIKGILPNVERIGVLIGPTDYDTLLESMGAAQTQYGITVIPIKLNNVKQKLPQYVKTAAVGVVKNHGIQVIMFVEGTDSVTKSPVGIKFTASALKKQKVPVFSPSDKALKVGCLGQFIMEGEQWKMKVSNEIAGEIGVTVPSGDPNFLPE